MSQQRCAACEHFEPLDSQSRHGWCRWADANAIPEWLKDMLGEAVACNGVAARHGAECPTFKARAT